MISMRWMAEWTVNPLGLVKTKLDMVRFRGTHPVRASELGVSAEG